MCVLRRGAELQAAIVAHDADLAYPSVARTLGPERESGGACLERCEGAVVSWTFPR